MGGQALIYGKRKYGEEGFNVTMSGGTSEYRKDGRPTAGKSDKRMLGVWRLNAGIRTSE